MVEKFSPEEFNPKEVTVNNPPALFMILISLKKQKLEEMGFVITETRENIVEEKWSGVSAIKSCDWIVKICKDGKELVLKGLVDSRFNTGGLPVETSVEKNDFSKEELEKFYQT